MSPAPVSLLDTLTSITKAWETRHSLLHELESAMNSFLTSTPISLSNPSDLLAPSLEPTDPSTRSSTSCTSESQSSLHVRPPNESELNQLLSISFAGLLEVKGEISELKKRLKEELDQARLARVVEKVEELESKRIKITLERDQLRRLSTLQPELEFSQSINEKDQERNELAEQIREEKEEIQAELIDLKAAAQMDEE